MSEIPTAHNRRRISLVTTELSVGGAEQCLVQLATRLDPQRYLPVVYSLAPPPVPPRDALLKRLAEAGIPVRCVGVRHAVQLRQAVRQLSHWFREQQPALVQSFLFHANIVAAWAARRAGVPRLVTGWRVADQRRCRPYVERLATRRADRVICVSPQVASQARAAGFSDRHLIVIPNGVDAARFAQARPLPLEQLGLPASRKIMLAVGRLDRQKGFDWLIEQLAGRLEALPEYDLVIVGEGPQRSQLESLAAARGVRHRVHLPGWRGDIPALFAAAALVVIPSRWEGMPNVLLEAMASGRAVVATRVEGVAEVLGPLAEFQSVEPGDAAGFLERIETLANDPRLAARWGAENATRVADQFTLEAMVRAYERVYDDLWTAPQAAAGRD